MIQRGYIAFSEGVEYALSRWWGWTLYLAGMVLAALVGGWDGLDRYIYVSGAIILAAIISNERRSQRAMHIKLDEIDPRPDHNALERRDEREMEG